MNRRTTRHREGSRRAVLCGALLLSLAMASTGAHAVWRWLQGSAVTDFKESDWALIQQTAELVLNGKPDGEQVNWSNPETGNRGSIMALATFTHEGRTCRRAAIRNISFRNREGRATYSLCRQDDGEWMLVSESELLGPPGGPPRSPEADAPPVSGQKPCPRARPEP